MPYRLRVTSGKDKGTLIGLEEGHVLTLGRSPSNDICITDHKMSRIHCQIELTGSICSLTDLNSTNGTFFENERIDEVAMEDGDSFSLGFTAIRFERCEDGETEPPSEEEKDEKVGSSPRILVCNECGREIPETSMAKGEARQIGSGFYCAVCSREFADVEIVEEGPAAEEGPEEEEESEEVEAKPVMSSDTQASLDPLMGQVVAGNKITDKISEGPLGSLYQAGQASMKRTVALRILRRGPEMTEDILADVLERVRAAGRLCHPNIIVIHDVGQQNNLYYISMEYVEGESVRDILLKHKRLVTPDALRIVGHVARALRHAWENGHTHGDVRPSNILVGRRGTSKLTDFGVLPQAVLERMRPARQLAYLRCASPERVADKDLGTTSDVYSLGATFYHMICGRPPVDCDSLEDLHDRILHNDVPPPSSLREDVPPELDEVILKMVAKSPADRYENPGELLKALKRAAKDVKREAYD